MDIKEKIERVRNLMYTVENWDLIIEEKRRFAAWGNGRRCDAAKVQTTPRHDRLESVVLDVQDMEGYREKLFSQCWEEKEKVMAYVTRCAPVEDWKIIHRYMMGCNLSEIPLKGKQKNPMKVIEKAIERLQAGIDREEIIAQLPKGVQKLIEGEKRQCKHCGTGFVAFEKEDTERFIFVCDGCGRRTNADKKTK